MRGASQLLALLAKDMVRELRTRQVVAGMLLFALLGLVTLGFALDPAAAPVGKLAGGLVWVVFLFAGLMGLYRSLLAEAESGTLAGLLAAPVDRALLFFGKVAGNLLFVAGVEAVAFPVSVALLHYRVEGPAWSVALPLVLGTYGFVTLGTLVAAVAARTRAGELVMPVLLLPLLVPLMLGAVESTGAALRGELDGPYATWLRVMVAYDLLFTAVPYMLAESVLEG